MNTKVVGVFASILAALIIGMMLGQWSMRKNETWHYERQGRVRTSSLTSEIQEMWKGQWVDMRAVNAEQDAARAAAPPLSH